LADTSDTRGWMQRHLGFKRILMVLVFLCAGGVSWYCWRSGIVTPEILFAYVDAHPLSAPVVYVSAYALAVFFMIPSLPLNIGAGLLWGPLWGSIITLIASSVGSIMAFLFARTAFGRQFVQRYEKNRLLEWLLRELDTHQWQVMAFIRLNMAFPSGPVNYLLALTPIRATTYCWTTIVFLYPLGLAFAFAGHMAGSIVLEGGIKSFFFVLAALSAVAAAFVLSCFVRKYYREKKESLL